MPEKVNVEADLTCGHNGLCLLPVLASLFPDAAPAPLVYNLVLLDRAFLNRDVRVIMDGTMIVLDRGNKGFIYPKRREDLNKLAFILWFYTRGEKYAKTLVN